MTREGRKEDYQGKEGSQPREGRKSTKGRKEDYQGKEGRLPREGSKITKGRKEDNQNKEGRLPKEGRKSTNGRKEDDYLQFTQECPSVRPSPFLKISSVNAQLMILIDLT